jgi:hypothetical protein
VPVIHALSSRVSVKGSPTGSPVLVAASLVLVPVVGAAVVVGLLVLAASLVLDAPPVSLLLSLLQPLTTMRAISPGMILILTL